MPEYSAGFGWTAAEDYAAERDMPVSEVVSYLLDGVLEGGRFGNCWYVAPPLALLEEPAAGSDVAHLRLSVYRMGDYLTAGHGELVIPLAMHALEPAVVCARIMTAKKRTPEEPLAVMFNGRRWSIDSSLWLDVSAALVEFQILATGSTDPIAMPFQLGLPEAP